MRRLIAAVAAAGVMFALGGLFFAGFGEGFFRGHFGHLLRPVSQLPVWAVFLEKLIQAAVMTWLFVRLPRAGSALHDGARVGAFVAALVCVPWALSMWSNYPLPFVAVAVVAFVDAVRITLAGIVIGAIAGRAETTR